MNFVKSSYQKNNFSITFLCQPQKTRTPSFTPSKNQRKGSGGVNDPVTTAKLFSFLLQHRLLRTATPPGERMETGEKDLAYFL